MRRETRLGPAFDATALERAVLRFVELYGVRPTSATCAPDVFARCCALRGRADEAHRHATRLDALGLALVTAVLAPGTIVFEADVDEERMGDW